MEKMNFYYYEKDNEMYAVKKISDYDIDYTIKASHHAYDIWRDIRLSISRKLKYYSMQEDAYIYFDMKEDLPSSFLNKLEIEETICDKTIYNIPKELISKCMDLFTSEDNEKALWVYTNKNRFCDSSFDKKYYGRADIFDLVSYLADRQYRIMLNEDMYLNASEVYAICDYPIHNSSVSCEIRDINKMENVGYMIYSPKKDLLKEYKEVVNQSDEYLDIAIDVSKYIKNSLDEIKTLIKYTKKTIEEGNSINLMLCVKNKRQKEIIHDLIDDVFQPKKVMH